MKYQIRTAYWKIRIVFMALRWVPRFNLGDQVTLPRYGSGKVWTLYQGVDAPTWKAKSTRGELCEVHEDEMQKVRSPLNYWVSFRSGYRFYTRNWLAIWVRKGWRIPHDTPRRVIQ